MGCLFCSIIKREIPATIVYEDSDVLAFLDISQVTEGHTLVIPKMHFDDVLACEPHILQKVSLVSQKIAQAQMAGLKATGINILTNARKAAGQSVFHYHVHVIPRKDNDDYYPTFPNHKEKYSVNQLQMIASKIKSGL